MLTILEKEKKLLPQELPEIVLVNPKIGKHYPALITEHVVLNGGSAVKMVYKVALSAKRAFEHSVIYETEGSKAFLYDAVVDTLTNGNLNKNLVTS